MEILDLSWNGFSNTGVAALGVALKVNKTLKVLDIRLEPRDPDGVYPNCSINVVMYLFVFSNNRIGDEGAKKFGPCIAKNTALETLLVRKISSNLCEAYRSWSDVFVVPCADGDEPDWRGSHEGAAEGRRHKLNTETRRLGRE